MNIETKYNIGDTFFCCTDSAEIIKVTVESIDTKVTFEDHVSIHYHLEPYFSRRIAESKIMTREEAIRKFEEDRSRKFLELFA